MKYFTNPEGKFVIKIPIEWQYMNVAVGHEEISPYSFQLYEGKHSVCYMFLDNLNPHRFAS
jgi:hypothetical protein